LNACWIEATLALILPSEVVETPKYDLIKQSGKIELRGYPAILAAETVTSGARRSAVSQGFSPLARYIFAKEGGRQSVGATPDKIAMTAPVTQVSDGDTWRVRFLMPSSRNLQNLPAPASGVEIVEIPSRVMAAIRFPGGMEGEVYELSEAALRKWIEQESLTITGPPTFAYYNDPFTPSFLRRNEILIPVR